MELGTDHEDVNVEIDADADGHDEDDGRRGAEFDAEQSQDTEQFDDDRRQDEDAQRCRPDAHQRHAEDQENGHQDAGQRQEQEKAQFQILFPEGERNSGRKVGQSAVFELFADAPHLYSTKKCKNRVSQGQHVAWFSTLTSTTVVYQHQLSLLVLF